MNFNFFNSDILYTLFSIKKLFLYSFTILFSYSIIISSYLISALFISSKNSSSNFLSFNS